jgi:hypothetical protein
MGLEESVEMFCFDFEEGCVSEVGEDVNESKCFGHYGGCDAGEEKDGDVCVVV